MPRVVANSVSTGRIETAMRSFLYPELVNVTCANPRDSIKYRCVLFHVLDVASIRCCDFSVNSFELSAWVEFSIPVTAL